MKYTGVCYRNSKLVPASAEEPQSAMMARDLLLDKNGNYVGNDRAIFAKIVTSDNDTQAPFSFIRKQNHIIGRSVTAMLPNICRIEGTS